MTPPPSTPSLSFQGSGLLHSDLSPLCGIPGHILGHTSPGATPEPEHSTRTGHPCIAVRWNGGTGRDASATNRWPQLVRGTQGRGRAGEGTRCLRGLTTQALGSPASCRGQECLAVPGGHRGTAEKPVPTQPCSPLVHGCLPLFSPGNALSWRGFCRTHVHCHLC